MDDLLSCDLIHGKAAKSRTSAQLELGDLEEWPTLRRNNCTAEMGGETPGKPQRQPDQWQRKHSLNLDSGRQQGQSTW